MLGKALELAVGLRGKARIAVEGGAEGGSLEVVACLGIMDVMLGGHAWRGATDVGKRIIAEYVLLGRTWVTQQSCCFVLLTGGSFRVLHLRFS